ncbi:hypothetical protein [Aquimonas voraii]|uniref:Metallo-peptidase family M12B Reprolysin-like n=1 Tax=Aquimonas voraii TaxID=265719 RepID=A0A1G6S3D1_9GAMM|nr:hypothetical protein [Aquimonas voraii]SDD11368.1 hypothetical protein SAMN04488509_101282 [Aquimonas voraii]
MKRLARSFILASIATPALGFAQSTPLALLPGQPQELQIPGRQITTSWVVDVPADARRMRLELAAANPAQDVDLLLRRGTPFDLRTEGGIDVNQFFDQAHYRSASAGGEEFLLVSDANPIALSPGRWHIGLVNFDSAPADASLTVSFQQEESAHAQVEFVFDHAGTTQNPCDTSGWNDSTPLEPARGNPGTTLGEQRREAARAAARLLSEQLKPRLPVRIQACWSDLGDATGNRFTLAQAAPQSVFVSDVGFGSNLPALERDYTWFAMAAAAQQLGTSSCRIDRRIACGGEFDVRATFNSKLDQPGAARFDYGINSGASGVGSSFVSVALHEVLHGLGIFGLVNLEEDADGPIGAKLRLVDGGPAWDDAYGARAVAVNAGGEGFREFLRISDAERAAALTSFGRLRFAGERAATTAGTLNFAPPDNFIRLHSPTTIEAGSTYSHIQSFASYGPQLMYPTVGSTPPRELGIAGGMLRDLGWRDTPGTSKTFSSAPSYQFYDPARSGHGIDFRLISPSITGRDAEYFLGFYTFDADGNPEWYVSSGPVVDGVFVPARNTFGDSLLRQNYLGPNNSVSDASAAYSGTIRINFNNARLHPACQDGHPDRRLDGPLAVMTARINGERIQWCMQPVVMPGRVQRDFSSIWYSLGDSGWGLALQSFDGSTDRGTAADGLFSILFYADATGKPRWAIGQATDFRPGQAQPLRQVAGYCRTCPSTDGIQLSEPIGSMTLDLVQGGAGAQGNRISFDVTYPGTEGGRFQRDRVNLFPNSDPTLGGN